MECHRVGPDVVKATAAVQAGLAAHHAGRVAEAASHYRTALGHNPVEPNALYLLGMTELASGHAAEGETLLRRALAAHPDFPHAHFDLGVALVARGALEEGIAHQRRAVASRPQDVRMCHALGAALLKYGEPAQAVACFRAVLTQQPDHLDALHHLGVALTDTDDVPAALPALSRVRTARPESAHIHNNIGTAFYAAYQLDAAEDSYRHAITLDPTLSLAHNNLGVLLRDIGRITDSIKALRRAIALAPDDAEPHHNLAMSLLLSGNLEEGWTEYEWRWGTRAQKLARRHFTQPLWRGQELERGTLLLHAEQGLGDTLQFCRYVPQAAQRARVVLEVQPPLVRLLSGLPGAAAVIAQGDALPPFDAQIPLMSLPLAFGTRLDTIPASVPYLRPAQDAMVAWRERLCDPGKLRVGLAWAGAARSHDVRLARVDRRRSVRLSDLLPLADVPGVVFVSLQKDDPGSQAAAHGAAFALRDWTADLQDFADTAALVSALDLVITVDTAVAHLAGALGRPVWMLNRFDTCWRWLAGRDDSPWYPTLRQFRQAQPGDWSVPLRAARDALAQLASRADRRDTDHAVGHGGAN
jgi:tetratricopeptide (TPR) repeat protein